MNLIQRLHAFWTSIGISPKLADPFVAGVVGLLINLAFTGSLDLGTLKVLVGGFALSVLGAAAPPVAGQTVKALAAKPHRRQR